MARKSPVKSSRASLEDLRELAVNIRDEDAKEIFHATGLGPFDALQDALRDSEQCWTVRHEGVLVCMWGVVKGPGVGLGIPWLIATDHITHLPKTFVREFKETLGDLLDEYPMLLNMVWERNSTHVDLLEHLGFTFTPQREIVNGEPFIVFHKLRE